MKSKWKTYLLLSVFVVGTIAVAFPRSQPAFATGETNDLTPFKFVWNDLWQRYDIVSDRAFRLTLFILSLPDVGNYRLSNHSDIVRGVMKAAEIKPNSGELKELMISYDPYQPAVRLNLSVSCVIIDDWTTYKNVVENPNNTIIVNTHDEYLPVPTGHSKEEWTDKVADLMLNRWGTWVHVAGYPLSRVWYENGTTEEWGDEGFQQLMKHIGKGNVTCNPPQGLEAQPTTVECDVLRVAWGSWPGYAQEIHLGFALNLADFSENLLYGVTNEFWDSSNGYLSGGAFRFSPNITDFNFGVYVHLGAWNYEGPAGYAAGLISTATAIFVELVSVRQFFGQFDYSAAQAIETANKEGRTNGLEAAKILLRKALDSYVGAEYKMSRAYAYQAKAAADSSVSPNNLPAIAAIVAVIAAPLGAGIVVVKRKEDRKNRGYRVRGPTTLL